MPEFTDEMRQLLTLLMAEESGLDTTALTIPPITLRERGVHPPLAFAQQRLWFLDQFEPGNTFYNMPAAFRLKGALNVPALRRSLNQVIQRHEVLRTTFSSTDGVPFQVISPKLDIECPLIDLLSIPDSEKREAEALTLYRDEVSRPFDLQQGPLLRAILLRLGPEEHILAVNMHHIICDGWSIGVLIGELCTCYRLFSNSTALSDPLRPLPFQYADFAIWQREWLNAGGLEQLSYWKRNLAGELPVLHLPTDRPRPRMQTYKGGTTYYIVPTPLLKRLDALSDRYDATLFMTLLAAFKSLLYRYTGQHDLIVGSPIANRNRTELEPLIGFFVNTLPLRNQISGENTFADFLKQVRETTLNAYAYSDVPFEKLVEEVLPDRDLSTSPLFQVMFALQNAPAGTLELPDLSIEEIEVDNDTAKFDLVLEAIKEDDRLRLSLEYNSDLFDEQTARRMLQHYVNILDEVTFDASIAISHLQLLSETECHSLIATATGIPRELPKLCVHELVEKQAQRSPEAIAITFAGQSLTYYQLNERADCLAHYLRELGVEPDVLVGLCVERSLEMVIGLLSVLKAGGAYISLDPTYPPAWLQFILEDARPRVILIQEHLRKALQIPVSGADNNAVTTAVVALDTEWKTISTSLKETSYGGFAGPSPTPANLAYVLYTSGSTGRPKGVAMSHASLHNLLAWQREVLADSLAARTLQYSSINFDASFQEIFSTWEGGGTLVLISEEDRRDPRELLRVLRSENVQRLFLPFIALQQLAETATSAMDGTEPDETELLPRSLRHIITAGEQLRVTPQLQSLMERLEKCELHNQYGPMEAHVVTAHRLPRDVSQWPLLPPIGRPIANLQVYILDELQQLVPPGVVGEIYLGGAGLARGYLNRPDLTAERFVVDPFDNAGGKRLFRTGDLGRYLANGEIEFLERRDGQVKVRGYRIELAEINARLGEHAWVKQSAVNVCEDRPNGHKQIVAYVTLTAAAEIDCGGNELQRRQKVVDILRRYLSELLPDYMAPSTFVILEEMPLTPSGKLDYRGLPTPDESYALGEIDHVEPSTEWEERLAGIWAEVLGLSKVSVTANFFEMGGHSLLATQVVSRMQRLMRVNLPVRVVFERPNIRRLAQYVAEIEQERAMTTIASPRKKVAEDDDVLALLKVHDNRSEGGAFTAPLSFAQRRLWFLDQFRPGDLTYNLSAALQIRGQLNRHILQRSLQEIVRRHESLRTVIKTHDGTPLQVVQPATSFEVPLVDLSLSSEERRREEATNYARSEFRKPFVLSEGPLFRASLIRLSDQDHILAVSMHHIISDAWSIGILFKEFAALYEAFGADDKSRLPEPKLQYADYAVWQRERLHGSVLQTQLAYWKGKLGNNPPVLQLPTDQPRPKSLSGRGTTLTVALDKSLTKQLHRLSQEQGVTLFVTIFSAFQVLLFRYTRQEDLILGTSIAGRNHASTEGLIGLFVNILAIRSQLSSDERFSSFLQKVHEALLGAYANQDLPFEILVDELRIRRDTSRAPLAQVMFVLLNTPMPTLNFSGLSVSIMEIEGENARADLSVVYEESDNGLAGVVEYSTDLFDQATIQRLFEHYRNLLESIVADPTKRLSELKLLGKAEEQELLKEWSQPFADTRSSSIPVASLEVPLHVLFEEQVARNPDAPAVICGNQTLTFAQLNESANRLGHCLREDYAVTAGEPIGMVLNRTERAIIAILGILKAGGAYVPIDPTYPSERIAFMVDDLQLRTLIVDAEYIDLLTDFNGRLFVIDLQLETLEVVTNFEPQNRSDDLAYILYTSGSTGNPKGVAVSERAIIRLVSDSEYVNIGPQDRVAQLAPITFDAATFEIWSALIHGASLVVIPKEVVTSPLDLTATLEEFGVSTIFLTTALFNQVVQQIPSAFSKLRSVLFGGEAVNPQWVAEILRAAPPERLLHVYGPTECTTFATWHLVEKKPTGSSVPIGRPVANTSVYILDEYLQPVPIGVAGELYLGGTGLARGYWNLPDLTAEKFIPNPFEDGERIYRTGDLVRYLSNGSIEFLGRVDHQFKIHGFRVEPGEIEAALKELPAIADAVAVLSERLADEKRIVAYIVMRQPAEELAVIQLRESLRTKLPEFMIPSVFVMLECMPLTANGKVSRDELPDPNASRMELGQDYEAPQTEIEKTFAEVWSQTLGVSRVGIHDNYFALGGDSITSIKVVSELKRRNIDITLEQLFRWQSIAQLTAALEVEQEKSPATVRQTFETAPFDFISEEDRKLLPADVVDAYPIATLQAGMFFFSSFEDSSAYHDIFTYQVRARYNLITLMQVCDEIIAAHPILRTSFHLTGFSVPLQCVHESVAVPFEECDLSQMGLSEQNKSVWKWVEKEKRHAFDLQQPPLCRFMAFKRGADCFEVGISFHHALMDGWSFALILSELLQRYLNEITDTTSFIPSRPRLNYRDFITAEIEAVKSKDAQSFWKMYLDSFDFLQVPRLLGERPTVASRICAGSEWVQKSVGEELFRRLFEQAVQWALPLKSLLLAAHLRVLSFIGNQRCVVTGLVTNGRLEAQDGDRVVGLHLNTIPLRVTVGTGNWKELATAAFDNEQKISPYRRYPLAQIQSDLGNREIFETSFNFINFSRLSQDWQKGNGLEVCEGVIFTETTFTLAVTFALINDGAGLELSLEGNRSDVSRELLERFSAYYLNALGALVSETANEYSLVSLLGREETHTLLESWNSTDKELPPDQCLHLLFEEQVKKTPAATAVVFENASMTYEELNCRVNQLAHFLRKQGVGPDCLVGLCLDRSLELVISMLGVLKAGGAYVPLDPGYPALRLTFMAEDAGLDLLLTGTGINHPAVAAKVISLDSEWTRLQGESTQNPIRNVSGLNLAYVIYTSGSTGKPKGAMNTHEAICNRILWMQDTFALSDTDCVLQKTTFAFDVSIWEFFWPLVTGARLVVARPDGHNDPDYIAEVVAEQQVTTLHFVPSMLRICLEEGALSADLKSLRRVICSGEVLSLELQQLFFDRLDCELYNLYGPTEAAIDVTFWKCEREGTLRIVPIGRPITNTQLYVLDDYLLPVPTGVPGELYIGGVCLARGYLNRPELTAERFRPNPLGNIPGKRLYRTGDRVRYLSDGSLEFLGRQDEQMKVRGFRIEPSEVEAVLKQHPEVREALIVTREQLLVAYLVADAKGVPSPQELRRVLSKILPDYMVPSGFVYLETLPLTPSGKIDRLNLPPPDFEITSQVDFVAPRTPLEELIAACWTRIMGINRVGVNDDFFELGGHSISAAQVVSRLREHFHTEISIRELFEAPTVAALARRLAHLHEIKQGTAPAALKPVPTGDALLLSFAQQQLWSIARVIPDTPFFNMPVALRARGPLDVLALELSFSEILQRQEQLRATFTDIDGRAVLYIGPSTSLSIQVTDLQELPEGKREDGALLLAAEEAWRPFDLARGPLLRVHLLRLGDDDHVLLLTMHHLIGDGWSMGVLLHEVSAAYRAMTEGYVASLPALPVQYADFAYWQRQCWEGGYYYSQLVYWKQQLAHKLERPQLPTDHSRPSVPTFKTSNAALLLPNKLSQAVRNLSRTAGGTVFMTLLGALKVLLYHLTNHADVCVGTLSANRNRLEFEPLIGLFANTLALRTDLSGDPTFQQLLNRVRETVVGAFTHQELPFETLMENLKRENNLDPSSLFQVLFLFQNTPLPPFDLPGLAIDSFTGNDLGWELGVTPTTFDLIFVFADGAEGFEGVVKYKSELFEASTIDRMLKLLVALLESGVADPEQKLSELISQSSELAGRRQSAKG